ncbi:hypothetical protein [Actinoplanes couchii]|uniref:SnoaL-like domain-containing protein n=1 Tax=Actinoplanes couchii TaxID=403638 RepID=A0ABQ3XSU3_9ACTN|nr:hypothetical protein [Actinoplanes couchii]MDR6324061.1 hypothetical protein [Actinoplanes couchii]GID61588.1 hypothetical protein Aco03nite_099920 [Actinoplanes couchii]
MTMLDEMSPASADLIFAALAYALENAGLSDAGFTPFAFSDSPKGRGLTRFLAGEGTDLQECLAAGRTALRVVEHDVTCVALAWDGYYTHEGRRSEAVFVEGYQIGHDRGVMLAQRYTRQGGTLSMEGSPVLIDEPVPLVQSRRGAVAFVDQETRSS